MDAMNYFTATAEELLAVGFRYWDKSSGDNLLLCPERLFSDLPDGIVLHDIFGNPCVKGRDRIDDDTRGGFLAYGIVPGKTGDAPPADVVAEAEAARISEFQERMCEVVRVSGIYVPGRGLVTGEDAVAIVREMNAPTASVTVD